MALVNQLSFKGKVKDSLEKDSEGFYHITFKGEEKVIQNKYFAFTATSLQDIINSVDFSQVEEYTIESKNYERS